MPSRLNPYLSFPGTARQALEFYGTCSAASSRSTRSASSAARRSATPDKIMHGQLETPAATR